MVSSDEFAQIYTKSACQVIHIRIAIVSILELLSLSRQTVLYIMIHRDNGELGTACRSWLLLSSLLCRCSRSFCWQWYTMILFFQACRWLATRQAWFILLCDIDVVFHCIIRILHSSNLLCFFLILIHGSIVDYSFYFVFDHLYFLLLIYWWPLSFLILVRRWVHHESVQVCRLNHRVKLLIYV